MTEHCHPDRETHPDAIVTYHNVGWDQMGLVSRPVWVPELDQWQVEVCADTICSAQGDHPPTDGSHARPELHVLEVWARHEHTSAWLDREVGQVVTQRWDSLHGLDNVDGDDAS